MAEKRIKLVIDTDSIPRTWKPYDDEGRYLAACSPFVEVGSLPKSEYEELKKNSAEDGDGWMVERVSST